MTVEIVSETGSLAALADSWRALAERRSNAFLTPEWYLAWLRHYGEGARPAVGVARDADGRATGIVPLVAAGSGPMRSLRFAGGALGDLFHPLSDGDDRELVAATLDALRGAGERGALVLDKVEPQADWVRALTAAGRSQVELAHTTTVLPEIGFAGRTWEEYLATRSRNLRSQLGRRRRRLERDHELVLRLSDRARLEGDLESFFALHRERWAERGGSRALDPRSMAFHADFAAAALERGWLRLWVMEVDERPAAAWYGWRIGERYAYYLAGFDESFAALSVGTVLLAHTMQSACEEGAAVYDLLLGAEDYKARFATAERRVTNLIVAPRMHPVRVAAAAQTVARGAADRLPPAARSGVKRRLRGLADRLPFR